MAHNDIAPCCPSCDEPIKEPVEGQGPSQQHLQEPDTLYNRDVNYESPQQKLVIVDNADRPDRSAANSIHLK
jgi:hypothetical protein